MNTANNQDSPAILDVTRHCQNAGKTSIDMLPGEHGASFVHDANNTLPGGRPSSLQAHESALDFDSFSYATLPNSASPDILARWRHLRMHSRANALGIGRSVSDTWGEESCCRQLLRRRILIFLVVLLTGIVMASVAIASAWLTSGHRHGHGQYIIIIPFWWFGKLG